MHDMQDKRLHEFINRRLKHYEAPYQEEHWARMSEKIEFEDSRNAGLRNIYRYFISLLVLGVVFWGVYQLMIKPVPTEMLPSTSTNEMEVVRQTDISENLAGRHLFPGEDSADIADHIFLNAGKYVINKMSQQQTAAEAILRMQYGIASGENQLLEDIPAELITKIQLYYTDYPKGKNLDYLNKRRFRYLLDLLPDLAKNRHITWEVISQRGAMTKEVARKYFHGFKIYYDVEYPWETTLVSVLPFKPPVELALSEPGYETFLVEHKIRQDILRKKIGGDSTTYKVFERNWSKWNNAVVICDWTTSMFKYGTQVVSWLSEHEDAKNFKGFVFFNVFDSEGRALQDSDKPGQMFQVKSTRTGEVLEAMIAAVRKGGQNGDLEENDAEAIRYAYESFPEAKEIVLIADNVSPVRNMNLIEGIKKPVKIIICGTTLIPDLAIQPDYFAIARQTGGSIHTIEDDLESMKAIKKGTWIKVGDVYYKYKNMTFKATNKKRRPRGKPKKSKGRR